MASQNTFVEGLDPTPLGQVSASQLLQIVREADPAENLGLVIHQEAQPDIDNNPWMARCYWRQPTSAPLVIRVFDKGEWKQAAMLPADNSIVNSMIKDGEITDSKIVSLSWSKLIGDPPALLLKGKAGGDLTGDYPDPIIANNKVTTPKLANYAVTGIKIAPGSVGGNQILNGGVTSDKLAGDITFDLILPLISTGVPVGANQAVKRNADNTAWEPFGVDLLALSFIDLGEQAIVSLPNEYNVFPIPTEVAGVRVPRYISARLVCKIEQLPFRVDDEVDLLSGTLLQTGSDTQDNPIIWANKAFVLVRAIGFSSDETCFLRLIAPSGAINLILARWKIKVQIMI